MDICSFGRIFGVKMVLNDLFFECFGLSEGLLLVSMVSGLGMSELLCVGLCRLSSEIRNGENMVGVLLWICVRLGGRKFVF